MYIPPIIPKMNEKMSKRSTPLSKKIPARTEQPGPPLIHNIRGSLEGLLWDSTK